MQREKKRKKFHQALLNLYHPPPPPPPSPPPPELGEIPEQEAVGGGVNLDFDQVDNDEINKESSQSDTSDCVPQKLTRAQRKRIRKRKLKEAASVRRKIIGPLFPSGYQQVAKDELSNDKMKTLQENTFNHVQDAT